MSEPIRINRLHSIWSNEVKAMHLFGDVDADCWLCIITRDGNSYHTEMANNPDPECPVNPHELRSQITALTRIDPTPWENPLFVDR